MSEIHREFERQLDGWHEQYADDVDREVLRLYLLALEREENVVVAYHDHVLGGRLATMAIPDDVRELMRRALASVRADEQMHVVAARTALRQLGRPMVAVRRYVHQFIGAMGGWTASVRQHRRWAEAPVSRATATLLLWAGRLTSRVPDTVRPHLDFLSFRDFCRYNVETEGTAWLCWQRLAELASHVPVFSGGQIDEMRRIADDEDRHRRVFATLAGVLTDEDKTVGRHHRGAPGDLPGRDRPTFPATAMGKDDGWRLTDCGRDERRRRPRASNGRALRDWCGSRFAVRRSCAGRRRCPACRRGGPQRTAARDSCRARRRECSTSVNASKLAGGHDSRNEAASAQTKRIGSPGGRDGAFASSPSSKARAYGLVRFGWVFQQRSSRERITRPKWGGRISRNGDA